MLVKYPKQRVFFAGKAAPPFDEYPKINKANVFIAPETVNPRFAQSYLYRKEFIKNLDRPLVINPRAELNLEAFDEETKNIKGKWIIINMFNNKLDVKGVNLGTVLFDHIDRVHGRPYVGDIASKISNFFHWFHHLRFIEDETGRVWYSKLLLSTPSCLRGYQPVTYSGQTLADVQDYIQYFQYQDMWKGVKLQSLDQHRLFTIKFVSLHLRDRITQETPYAIRVCLPATRDLKTLSVITVGDYNVREGHNFHMLDNGALTPAMEEIGYNRIDLTAEPNARLVISLFKKSDIGEIAQFKTPVFMIDQANNFNHQIITGVPAARNCYLLDNQTGILHPLFCGDR